MTSCFEEVGHDDTKLHSYKAQLKMASAFSAVRRFHRLSFGDKMLFLEATVLLAAASSAIAILPYRYVQRFADPRVRDDVEER